MHFRSSLPVALGLMLSVARAQAVLFATNTTLNAGDTAYDGQPIVVSNCTLTVNGRHDFTTLSLASNGVVTHSPAPNGETNNRLDQRTRTNHGALLIGDGGVLLFEFPWTNAPRQLFRVRVGN